MAEGPGRPGTLLARYFPEVNASGFTGIDSTVQFYQHVNSIMPKGAIVCDLGAECGAGHSEDPVPYRRALRQFHGNAARIVGLDVDPAVAENPSLDEWRLIESDGRLPLADTSVDLVLSDFTFEHIEHPGTFAAEICRILRPGGWLCARTPNKWGYVSIGARIVPERWHHGILKSLQPGRKSQDIFRAYYQLNTRAALAHHFPDTLWERHVQAWNPAPAYCGERRALWAVALGLHAVLPRAMAVTFHLFARRRRNG